MIPTSRPPYSAGQLTTDQRSSKMRALPGPVGLEAVGRVERGQGLGRDVGGQPGPGLGPEGLVLGR